MRKNTTLIAGPTASGKSGLALRFANATDGVVVNADSMQVYDVLRVVTARPSNDDMHGVPHHLFGHVPPSTLYSTGGWLADVEKLLARPDLSDRHIVIVGGTGMYFRALLGGMSAMPDISPEVRKFWRAALAETGPEALHAELAMRDPETAARLKPQDGQRIVRAIEVHESSGRPISFWQKQTGAPLVDGASARKICLTPERAALREKINRRFALMARSGAVEEVRELLALRLDPALPAMKAIGVSEIAAYLAGSASMDEAVERASAATRQYAKRQETWLRHQLSGEWARIAISGTGEL
jgi:tRNA dimethylallyltransferase